MRADGFAIVSRIYESPFGLGAGLTLRPLSLMRPPRPELQPGGGGRAWEDVGAKQTHENVRPDPVVVAR